MHPSTIALLRPMATCKKCAFAKNVRAADGSGNGSPRCHFSVVPGPTGPFPPVQSGDFCHHWTPRTADIAADALRILGKRTSAPHTSDYADLYLLSLTRASVSSPTAKDPTAKDATPPSAAATSPLPPTA